MAGRRPARRSARGPRAREGMVVFGREQVAELQRARIMTALASVVAERGVTNTSVAHVVERCGVSRRTFYEMFSDREDCLLATFDDAIERIAARVVPAWSGEGRWHERVRAALVELLVFMQREPLLARLVVVESSSAGARALERRYRLQSALAAAIEQGRAQSPKSVSASPLAAEGVVGGVSAVLGSRLLERPERPELLSLTGELMSMIVLPYLGSAAAAREAARPVPQRKASPPAQRNGGASLHELGMRLTYRTVRVLVAVADHAQASNREIGTAAGIDDQGQISKLLSRLARIGLIENTHLHPGKGAPNSWALTEKGVRIVEGIRTHTNDLQ